MSEITNELFPRNCKGCGKKFYPTPQWVYKDGAHNKKNVIFYCSYGCMRKVRKEKEDRKKQREIIKQIKAEEEKAAIARGEKKPKRRPANPKTDRRYHYMSPETEAKLYAMYRAGVKGYLAADELKIGRGTVYNKYKEFKAGKAVSGA